MGTAKELMLGLYKQALQNEHCDVTIEVHGKEYGAHRGVLVQTSPYFERMFSGHFCETQSGRISLTDVIPSTDLFEAILEHIYIGVFVPSAHDLEEVLGAARLLLLDNLVRACQQLLLEQLTLTNVLHTWAIADLYSLKQLEAVCRELVRCRFHDTIIHQPEVKRLPLKLLCHFIKEGMYQFLNFQMKMTVLQQWLKENTTPTPDDRKLLISEIAKQIDTVEPDVCTTLLETDVMSQDANMRAKEDIVDCIIKLSFCRSLTLNLQIYDLHQGQLHESSQDVPDQFSIFLGTVGRFIILQDEDKQDLCALDEKHQRTMELHSPNHVKDHHYFKIGKNIMCLVVSEELDIQDKRGNVRTTFFAGHTEAPLKFWLNYVESINDTFSDQPIDREMIGECKQKMMHLFQLELGCWLEMDSTEKDTLMNAMNVSRNHGPTTSSGLQPVSKQHDSPSTCLACPLTWKYMCDITLPKTDFYYDGQLDFQSVESGHYTWVMFSSIRKRHDEDNVVGAGSIDYPFSASLFSLQLKTQEDSGNKSKVKVKILPPPSQAIHRSASLLGCEKRCGSVRFHQIGSLMYFNIDKWKWEQREQHLRSCRNASRSDPYPDPPVEPCLPIFPKHGQIAPEPASQQLDDLLFFVTNTYPHISYLWRYNEEVGTWKELPSPSMPPDDDDIWLFGEVGRYALDTLPVVSTKTNKGDFWDKDTPYVAFQFESNEEDE